MSPPSDDDKVSCYYLSSDSSTNDNGVARLQLQSPAGEEEEDGDTDGATDGGRRAVALIKHYRQRHYQQRRR
jgi:hypothetical protein